eukprot:gene13424-9235_t
MFRNPPVDLRAEFAEVNRGFGQDEAVKEIAEAQSFAVEELGALGAWVADLAEKDLDRLSSHENRVVVNVTGHEARAKDEATTFFEPATRQATAAATQTDEPTPLKLTEVEVMIDSGMSIPQADVQVAHQRGNAHVQVASALMSVAGGERSLSHSELDRHVLTAIPPLKCQKKKTCCVVERLDTRRSCCNRMHGWRERRGFHLVILRPSTTRESEREMRRGGGVPCYLGVHRVNQKGKGQHPAPLVEL